MKIFNRVRMHLRRTNAPLTQSVNYIQTLMTSVPFGLKINFFKRLSLSGLLLMISSCGTNVVSINSDANRLAISDGADSDSQIIVNRKIIAEGYYLATLKSKHHYLVYFLNRSKVKCRDGNVYLYDNEISTLTIDRIYEGKFRIEKRILGNPSESKLNEFRDDVSDLKSTLPMLFFCSK